MVKFFFALLLIIAYFEPLYGKMPYLSITTANSGSIKLFNEGYIQLFAYNYQEAKKQFTAALAQDGKCAMCWWGLAMANKLLLVEKGESFSSSGVLSINKAIKFSKNSTFWEKELIIAATKSFSAEKKAKILSFNLYMQQSFPFCIKKIGEKYLLD